MIALSCKLITQANDECIGVAFGLILWNIQYVAGRNLTTGPGCPLLGIKCSQYYLKVKRGLLVDLGICNLSSADLGKRRWGLGGGGWCSRLHCCLSSSTL